jgi:hypothetical protein
MTFFACNKIRLSYEDAAIIPQSGHFITYLPFSLSIKFICFIDFLLMQYTYINIYKQVFLYIFLNKKSSRGRSPGAKQKIKHQNDAGQIYN